jgi:hypothetical protein
MRKRARDDVARCVEIRYNRQTVPLGARVPDSARDPERISERSVTAGTMPFVTAGGVAPCQGEYTTSTQ